MANYVTNTSDKSKKQAMILCCIGFAGIGGLHYFYVGKYGKGLLYLFTLGFFFIGTVKDLITIASGGFTDNVGAPLRE
ncbi:MAG: TM2 domain-containing protein [Paludibacteraceae bacterium]|nr:TM2 domain-containing protein [Paludibacteraceae bacterium]